MSLFTRPGVYEAGVAGAPATNVFHAMTGEMRTMMAPQDHMQQYAKSSPFLKSGGLQDHLMIIHGMKDDIVLFKDSITLEQRLILQGKDIDLVVLPNAPHGWDTQGLAQEPGSPIANWSIIFRSISESPATNPKDKSVFTSGNIPDAEMWISCAGRRSRHYFDGSTRAP